jgi:quinol monooxygenase YgiN
MRGGGRHNATCGFLPLSFQLLTYKIDPKLTKEFEENLFELGTILKSEGMSYWEVFQDPADKGHYLEIRIADTWTDHMRHHERVTKNVQIMEDKVRELLKDCPEPIVSHFIARSSSSK